ncbi:MAG: hypothetical protein MHM6MM_002916 [Cercozoa sp. M6MM]
MPNKSFMRRWCPHECDVITVHYLLTVLEEEASLKLARRNSISQFVRNAMRPSKTVRGSSGNLKALSDDEGDEMMNEDLSPLSEGSLPDEEHSLTENIKVMISTVGSKSKTVPGPDRKTARTKKTPDRV